MDWSSDENQGRKLEQKGTGDLEQEQELKADPEQDGGMT